MCRKKARAFPIVAGSGVGKDSMYLGMGGGKFCCFKMVWEKAGSGNPKTGSCTSRDPALVLDRFKFKSLICHQLATANICWFFC